MGKSTVINTYNLVFVSILVFSFLHHIGYHNVTLVFAILNLTNRNSTCGHCTVWLLDYTIIDTIYFKCTHLSMNGVCAQIQ